MHRPDTMRDILTIAETYGDRMAVKCEGRQISYSELAQAARASARRLLSHGVKPGDRVTLYAPNSIDWIIAYFATLESGAIVNPVNILNTADEVAFIAQDCGSVLVLADSNTALQLLREAGLPPLLTIDKAVDGLASINVEPDGSHDSTELAQLGPGDFSTISYTSGTTGRPKGAVLSHRAVSLNAANTAWMHERTSIDRCATALPLAHAYGAAVMNAALLVGAPLHVAAKFDPQQFLELLVRERITIMDGVPTMYAYLLALDNLDGADLSALRCCLVGGQAMPPAAMAEVERRFGAPLVELWGMTEIAGLGATHDVRQGHLHGSIGVPLPQMELRLADPADPSAEVAPGATGELIVRGPTVMNCYWNRPEATAEAIDPDGWLHSGDLATVDDQGRFAIVDRKKDMILSGGYNVYPAEIERVLAEHPDVAIAAVGRADDPARGEVPIAYVVARPGANCDPQLLLDHCRERLARYKLPRAIHFVDDMPKTSTGKIMRRALHGEEKR